MRHSPSPPATDSDLLDCLRSARLLPTSTLQELQRKWVSTSTAATIDARVGELVAARLLTSYQASQVLLGKAQRLRLGSYRVLDRLGTGGMGHVYRAEHLWMRRLVAIKVVGRWTRPDSRRTLARFRREIRAAGQLNHPNIVTTYDAGLRRGLLYLVMEHVHGVDLGRLVAHQGALPVPLACEIIRQAALGLQCAHQRGILHRDIKPENLMLAWPDAHESSAVGSLPSLPDSSFNIDAAVVKLLDLGLAWPTKQRERARRPLGTADYMAPEQTQPNHAVDGRADLYSLGCAAYFLLTGQVPFPGGTWSEKMLRHRLETPVPLRTLRAEIPVDVAAIVERLMAKDPAARFDQPVTVSDALMRLAERGWDVGEKKSTVPTPAPEAAPALPLPTQFETMASLAPQPESKPSFPELPPLAHRPLAPAAPPAVNQRRLAPSNPATPQVAPPTSFEMPLPTEMPRRQRPRPTNGPRRWPGITAVVASVGVGLLLAAVARSVPMMTKAPQTSASPVVSVPSAPLPPFQVEQLGLDFATLDEAIAVASDGDVILIRPAPTLRIPCTNLMGKELTLRAAANSRPRLMAEIPQNHAPWQPLLICDKKLTLEGLDIESSGDVPLVYGSGAALRLTDCKLIARGSAPAVVARGGVLLVRNSRIEARQAAVAVEVVGGPCSIATTGCQLLIDQPDGVGLVVWGAEIAAADAVSLFLDGNVIKASRIVSFRNLPAALQVEAANNTFRFSDALFSFAGYADNATWRRQTTWQGRDNHFETSGTWLQVDGRAFAVSNLETWESLWPKTATAARPTEMP